MNGPCPHSRAALRVLPACAVLLALASIATPQPANDSGAADAPAGVVSETTVGPVTARLKLTPAEPTIGDTIELALEVETVEGIELLMPEFGESLERFTIIDFVPVPQRLTDDGQVIALQRYTLQPHLSGDKRIPPILIEFVDHREGKPAAPEDADAYELMTDPLAFSVKSVIPEGATAELKPVLGDLPPRETPSPWRWPLAGVAVLVAALATPILIRAFMHWRRLARRRSAYDIARGALDRLVGRGVPEGDALDPFFVDLSGIIRRYIENRYELKAPEFTTEEFLDVVSGSGDISLEHQQLLRDFLKQADLVKFAHAQPGREDIQRSVALAGKFLDDTRGDAPLIDEDDDGSRLAPERASTEQGRTAGV